MTGRQVNGTINLNGTGDVFEGSRSRSRIKLAEIRHQGHFTELEDFERKIDSGRGFIEVVVDNICHQRILLYPFNGL